MYILFCFFYVVTVLLLFVGQKMNMNKQTSARYWFIYSKAIKKVELLVFFFFEFCVSTLNRV